MWVDVCSEDLAAAGGCKGGKSERLVNFTLLKEKKYAKSCLSSSLLLSMIFSREVFRTSDKGLGKLVLRWMERKGNGKFSLLKLSIYYFHAGSGKKKPNRFGEKEKKKVVPQFMKRPSSTAPRATAA